MYIYGNATGRNRNFKLRVISIVVVITVMLTDDHDQIREAHSVNNTALRTEPCGTPNFKALEGMI